ncbi:MAG: DUF4832 domain-containing protein [Caldilineaceae bacterium]|nr:DUF4832 domain-containing protein [Caldilineaceae bacterium]
MRFRAPKPRYDQLLVLLMIAILTLVLVALLSTTLNSQWLEQGFVPEGTAPGMVIRNPVTMEKRMEERVAVVYSPLDEPVPNPERGFYRYVETRSSAPVAYDAEMLTDYAAQGIRLLYCIHYLDDSVDGPISDAFLAHIQENLNRVRQARLKCILRFAYTDDDPTQRGEAPPFGDADKARIESHIEQLAPILRANSDIIAFVQAGFIGVWGEWYYTDHFVDDPSTPWIVSNDQYARRREVLTALLDALPVTRTVGVRYPFAKAAMFGDNPTGDQAGYAARTGFHNDCFLASDTDFGTYRDDQIDADKAYLAAQTQNLPLGGETCTRNRPRSQCPTALAELERFHWTYLNREYNEDVLADWEADGCLAEIEQRLGYRLVLKRGLYPTQAEPGAALSIFIELENEGFAAPINPRPLALVLRSTADGDVHILGINQDLRQWLPGSLHRIDDTLTVPADLAPGDYEMLLSLPDEAPSLAAMPAYAIRFANADTWDAAAGANRLLHTLHVEAPLPTEGTRVYLPNVEN